MSKPATRIKSELLLASKNATTGDILYTWRLTYPRIILSETLTHRMFSRSTSSTRAIPTMTMIRAVWNDMFVPKYIGSKKKGMVAGPEITGIKRTLAQYAWKLAGYSACLFAYGLTKLGVSKQIAGRVLEPFSWVTQIVSASAVNNFLHLRNHPDAEPHFARLARLMQDQVEEATSEFAFMECADLNTMEGCDLINMGTLQILEPYEWHIPFIKPSEKYGTEVAKRISAARCARSSYTLLGSGRETTMSEDLALCERLFGGNPKHLSPIEHQAQAMTTGEYYANFSGFKQFRLEIEGQNGGDKGREEWTQ